MRIKVSASAAYELVRQEILTELAAEPDKMTDRYRRLVASLKELEDAYAVAYPKANKGTLTSAVIYSVTTMAVAVLDRHFPLTGKAWSMIVKPRF